MDREILSSITFCNRAERVARALAVESAPLSEWTVGQWVDLILHRDGEAWRWQGEFHPRGPQVGGGFSSWLPYKEATEDSEVEAQSEAKT